jgi:hypothetical protein
MLEKKKDTFKGQYKNTNKYHRAEKRNYNLKKNDVNKDTTI